MTDFEKELIKAYKESLDAEINAVMAEAETYPYVFSHRFRKSMDKMIRTGVPDKLWAADASEAGASEADASEKDMKKKRLSRKGLTVLLIAAAILLSLAVVACTVPEIRESLAGFFVEIFGDHVEYLNPATKDSIEVEYGLVPIPKGFSLVNVQRGDNFLTKTYMSTEKDGLLLDQRALGSGSSSVDSNHGSFSEYEIGGRIVRLYYSDELAQASWTENGYYFSLSYSSHIELELFESWVGSVQILK